MRSAAHPGALGPFTAQELTALIAAAFVGTESQILLGIAEEDLPLRAALRRVGDVIAAAEQEDRDARKTAG